jgi:hypothetical protein
VNVVVDGFEKIRDPIYGGLTFAVDSGDDPRWFRVDLAMWRGHRAYVEFADGMTIDFTSARSLVREGAGFLALDVLCTSDHAEPPKGFTATPLLVPRGSLSTEIRSLLQAYAAKEAELAVPPLAPVLVDGTGENERLLRRGNPASPLAEVPRRAPQILAGTPIDEGESRGSGRLQLAFALVHSRAALPARVVVNRLWHHHFGRGLVPTTDDFGHMGEPPSHPELLDYLAGELISHQWSLKHVHRLMIMSHAYRLATEGQTNDPEIDPTNRLLAHYPIRRFEAEAIRDSVLAISGRLDERLGGPSVPIHLTPYMDGRGRPPESGPLDGDGRRSLYLSARRNFPNFLLAVFDLPPNTSTVGRRNTTNVPAQALALWNDPFILAEANRWGRSMAAQASESMESRIESMFLQAFARRPNVHELEAAWQLLRKGPNQGDAWGELAHVLFNSKEFVYLD